MKSIARGMMAGLIALALIWAPLFALASERADRTLLFSATSDVSGAPDRLLLEALKQLGYGMSIEATAMNYAIPMAASGQRDGLVAYAAGLESTNPELVMIREPLGSVIMQVYTRRDLSFDIRTWSDFAGLRVGSLYQTVYVESHLPEDVAGRLYKETFYELNDALLAGQCDVIVLPRDGMAGAFPPAQGVKHVVDLDEVTVYAYLNRRHEALARALETKLDAMRKDGTFDEIASGGHLNQEEKVLLHLSSYTPTEPWDAALIEGVHSVIDQDSAIHYENVPIYADRYFSEGDRNKRAYTSVRNLLATGRPDAVLVSDNAALEFACDYYGVLFSGTPIIYCGVRGETDRMWQLGGNVTGVHESLSVDDNVELIQKLYPNATGLFVINDTFSKGRSYSAQIRRTLLQYSGWETVEFSESERLTDLLARIDELPSGTVILVGNASISNGTSFVPRDQLFEEIAEATSAPIFVMQATDVGSGALGGRVIDPAAQGALCAELAAEVMNGVPAPEVPRIRDTSDKNAWLFDDEALRAQGVKRGDLPEGANYLNRTLSFYELNPQAAILMFALAVLGVMVIIGLVVFSIMIRAKNVRLIETQKNLHTAEEMLEKDQTLRESQAWLEAALDASKSGVFDIKSDARVIRYDERFMRIVGLDRPSPITLAELSAYLKTVLVDEGERQAIDALTNREVNEFGIPKSLKIRRKDGSILYIQNHAVTRYDEDANARSTIGLTMDVTELKQAELAVGRRLDQQQLMSSITYDFAQGIDLDKAIADALRGVGAFMRVDMAYVFKRDTARKVFTRTHHWASAPELLNDGQPVELSESLVMDDLLKAGEQGVSASTDIKVQPMPFIGAGMPDTVCLLNAPLTMNGELWGYLGVTVFKRGYVWSQSDRHLITQVAGLVMTGIERDEYQRQKEDALVNLQTVMNHFNGLVWCSGVDRKFMVFGGVSKLELDMVGLVGQPLERAYERYPDIEEHIEAAYRGKQNTFILSAEGMHFNCSATPILGAHGEVSGVVFSAIDTTEQIEMQRRLEQAIVTAQEANKAKSEFLSRMSHEIRTPMNAIIGMTKIAMSSDDEEKKQYCLEKIDTASVGLLEIINQILDMSKIEAGKMELAFGDFDFEKMVGAVCQVISVRTDEKQQTFTVNFEGDMPRMYVGDEVRLSQVVMNLLSNAVKFTPEQGKVSLSVSEEDIGEGRSRLTVAISDSGIGITPEQQTRLFKSFEQADGGISRKFGGTGLGLAICKRIVQMMNGDIEVTSTYGEGSTFTFTVELARSKEEASRTQLAPHIDHKTLNILAVDDIFEIREYFTRLMQGFGIACDVAENGYFAIDMAKKSVLEGRAYNVVFVDYRMPGMNGLETASRLREVLGRDAVVIMVSSVEWTQIRDDARKVGVERFVQKPLLPSTILNAINEVLGAPRDVAQDAAQQVPDLTGKTILLVEDVEINREIVLSFLEGTNAQADCAENGREALEMFERNPDRYDIIFMDLHMPEMGGYESTVRIRALNTPRAKTVPIVAMTANVFREDVEHCLSVGMNDHIGKPIDVGLLFEKLRKYLLP